MNFVTFKAASKHEFLYNMQRSVCQTSKSDLSGTTEFGIIRGRNCYEFGHT
jgi:hypothetical protein